MFGDFFRKSGHGKHFADKLYGTFGMVKILGMILLLILGWRPFLASPSGGLFYLSLVGVVGWPPPVPGDISWTSRRFLSMQTSHSFCARKIRMSTIFGDAVGFSFWETPPVLNITRECAAHIQYRFFAGTLFTNRPKPPNPPHLSFFRNP